MSKRDSVHAPQEENLLLRSIGPVLSPREAFSKMHYMPPLPSGLAHLQRHQRMLRLLEVRDFHVPPPIETKLQQTVTMMVWQGYRHRDPRIASTWGSISGEAQRQGMLLPTAIAASVEGLPGVGKTQACQRSLRCFPRQVIEHDSFPKLVGSHRQVVWLSVEVPPSGRAADFARALMQAWRDATGSNRFDDWLAKDRIRDGMRALDEWRQVAVTHFLGILHLDEIQNLFKLSSLRARKGGKSSAEPELSIVEDQLLRWLLQITNSGQIPLLVSGTPDGIGALTKRLSTLQRINTGGYHAIEPLAFDPSMPIELTFLGQLGRYQYLKNPLPMNRELAELIMDLTGGIQRVVVALWVAAQRVALERQDDTLKLEDFQRAMSTYLRPLVPAIDALKTGNPIHLSRYEDLVPRNTEFWSKYWGSPPS